MRLRVGESEGGEGERRRKSRRGGERADRRGGEEREKMRGRCWRRGVLHAVPGLTQVYFLHYGLQLLHHGQQQAGMFRAPIHSGAVMSHENTVCIVSRSEKEKCKWLKDCLSQTIIIQEVLIPKEDSLKPDDIQDCAAAILYRIKTEEEKDKDLPKLLSDLQVLFNKLGKEKIIVISDNHINTKNLQRTFQGNYNDIKQNSKKLILFPKDRTSSSFKKKIEKLEKYINEILSGEKPEPKSILKTNSALSIGICSREPKESYKWIAQLLETDSYKKYVKEIHSIYITNSISDFRSKISNCTFLILYHSKNRGRINITNVTDSLYDEELESMYKLLGKKNVVVVIDDLENSGQDEKNRIQDNQYSIKEWACQLFLFTKKDKHSIVEGKNVDPQVDSELETLRRILKEAKKNPIKE